MFRTLALASFVWAVCACPPARADDAEDKAVAFVEKLGGEVTRDTSKAGQPVVAVDLFKTKVTDAGVKELAGLTNLTSLSLVGTAVTDVGMKALTPLTNLTALDLRFTGMTDAGVKELQKVLPKCEILR